MNILNAEAITTPWGRAQEVTKVAEGLLMVETGSHGGYKLDRTLNKKIPVYLRQKGGWYEEDCEWAAVAVIFPEHFKHDAAEAAKITLRNWFPDAYETFYGVVLQPGESRAKDATAFKEKHKNDMVVISALMNPADDGTVICVASRGGVRRPGVEERWFLIPSYKYDSRGLSGYVISPEDQETDLRF